MRSKVVLMLSCALLAAGCGSGDESGNDAAATAAAGNESAVAQGTLVDALQGETRFAAAIKAAGLDRTLAGPGPYTVLAPEDAAFDKLPAGALDGLMRPAARTELTGVLTYHVLPGTILAEDIAKAIDNGKGKAVLATMGGGTISLAREGGAVVLTDAAGTKARLTRTDDRRANGVVHRIDAVLMPEGSS